MSTCCVRALPTPCASYTTILSTSSRNIVSLTSSGDLILRIRAMKCSMSSGFSLLSATSDWSFSILTSSSACSSSYCFISCLYCLSGSKPDTRFSYRPRTSSESSSYRFCIRFNSVSACWGFSFRFSSHSLCNSSANAFSSFITSLEILWTADRSIASTLSALIPCAVQESTLLAYPPQRKEYSIEPSFLL